MNSEYVIETSNEGKNLVNLLSNIIITEIEKQNKNHKTEIQVVNHNNFVLTKGYTTHKTPINFSILFNDYLKNIFNIDTQLGVIDLIEYDKSPILNPIYLKKKYIYNPLIDELKQKSIEDTINGTHYRYTVNPNLNIITTNNDMSDSIFNNYFKNYSVYVIDKNSNTFVSDINYGRNLNSSKLFEFYFNYITYNLFKGGICSEIEIEFFTDYPFNEIDWEHLVLNIKTNSIKATDNWIKSLILDIFTFKPNEIIKKWNLDTYNFENEILLKEKPMWKIRDKVSEMVLI